jgi:hypothetical protein
MARQKFNSEVVKPVRNSEDLLQRAADRWIIDTADLSLAASQLYKKPYAIIMARVKPHREKNRDKWSRENWWRPQRMRPEMRNRIQPLERFLVTTTTSKHRIFVWLQHPILPDHQLIVFSRDDDYFMDVLHSRFHEICRSRKRPVKNVRMKCYSMSEVHIERCFRRANLVPDADCLP